MQKKLITLIVSLSILQPAVLVVITKGSIDEEFLNYEPPLDLVQQFPVTLLGYDYEGSPEVGQWDFRPVLLKGPKEEVRLEKYFNYFLHKIFTSWRISPTGEKGVVVIADMEGYTLEKAADIKSVRFFLRQFSNAHRHSAKGKLKRGIIINSNPIFQRVFMLGKPLIGSLGESIELLGLNPGKWKPILLKLIPSDQLPPYLGGKEGDYKPLEIFGIVPKNE